MELTNEDLIEMYRLMLLTRKFETRTELILREGKLFDGCHTCIGEEAIHVGAIYKLGKDDIIMPSLRGRGVYITRGEPIKIMLAKMYGKQTGKNMPKESSHHHGVQDLGILVGVGVIGSDIAKATGAALAIKLKGTKQVVLDFFGDGASNRGDFHESLNLAGIWKLPIVYICENNQFQMSTTFEDHTACADIADRAPGYGMPGIVIRGSDVIAVHEAVQEAIKRARDGQGPSLIECKVYRFYPHVGLLSRERRSKDEIDEGKQMFGDPIEILKSQLMEREILTEEMVKDIEASIDKEIEEAIEYAENAPFPAPEEALKDVYYGR